MSPSSLMRQDVCSADGKAGEAGMSKHFEIQKIMVCIKDVGHWAIYTSGFYFDLIIVEIDIPWFFPLGVRKNVAWFTFILILQEAHS